MITRLLKLIELFPEKKMSSITKLFLGKKVFFTSFVKRDLLFRETMLQNFFCLKLKA